MTPAETEALGLEIKRHRDLVSGHTQAGRPIDASLAALCAAEAERLKRILEKADD